MRQLALVELTAYTVQCADAVGGHPNALPFRGILTRIDEPSDRSPEGAEGHRVLLPRAEAEKALPTLIGMAVNVTTTLKGHAPRQKVGIITKAMIEGNDLWVQGFLYAKDFPAEVARIRQQSQAGMLGMSYELAQAQVDDIDASVWTLRNFCFTGAAILQRNSAAYGNTSLAATAEAEDVEEADMAKLDEVLTQLQGLSSGFQAMLETDAQRKEREAQATAAAAEKAKAEALAKRKHIVAQAESKIFEAGNGLNAEWLRRVAGMWTRSAMQGETDVHEDALQDLDLILKLLGGCRMMMGSADAVDNDKKPAPTALEAKMAKLEEQIAAAMQLLTDNQNKTAQLITDVTEGNKRLRTEAQLPDNGGGPTRRTLVATKDEANMFAAKYGIDVTNKLTEAQVTKALRDGGVEDIATRMAVKTAFAAAGYLAEPGVN